MEVNVLDTIDEDTKRWFEQVNAKAREESPFGPLTVFREFKARLNAIEYTVFFKCHDEDMRIDLTINEKDIAKGASVKSKIYQMIEEHQAECQLNS